MVPRLLCSPTPLRDSNRTFQFEGNTGELCDLGKAYLCQTFALMPTNRTRRNRCGV